MKLTIHGSIRNISGFPVWIILPLLLFILTLFIGFNGLYSQDSFEYLRYSRAIHTFFTEGKFPGIFFWPLLYPLSGAIVSFVFPDVLSLQLISIACYGFTSFFLLKILMHLFPEKKKEITIYLLLFFNLSPFVLRYSSTVMSDAMAMFLITVFFYNYLLYIERSGKNYFLFLVLFGVMAINTRFASIMIILIPGLHVTYLFIRNFKLTTFIYALLITGIIFTPNICLNIYDHRSLIGQLPLPDWAFSNYFRKSFITDNGNLLYTYPNICFVFSNLFYPGFIFAGLLFLIFFRFRSLNTIYLKVMGMVIVTYSLFLAGLPTQNSRFLFLSFPCIIIIFSVIFQSFSEHFARIRKSVFYLLFLVIIIIQICLFYRALRPFYENCKATRHIAERMMHYPGKKLYTFSIDMALKEYGVTNETVSLWSNKIDFFEPNALVLFNFADTRQQWKEMNPMLNWESLSRDHHIKLLENFPEGWNLYEITD